MSTIDAHVHLYPPEVNDDPATWAATHGEPRWAALCIRLRKDGRAVQSFPSVDELLQAMDEAGVDRAVLLGWYWETAESCAHQNRFYASCVRNHPDRLNAFATVQPAEGGEAAVHELRRCRDEGLIGLGELSPHAQGYEVKSEEFSSVLRVIEAWRWPVNLHVTDPASASYPGRVETPRADFIGLARLWPGINFILAHWGGGLAWDEAPEVTGLKNVFYDTAASPLLYPAAVWTRGIGVAGATRVLFGSDFPLNLFPRAEPAAEMRRFLAEAKASGISPGDLKEVLAGTAGRLIEARL